MERAGHRFPDAEEAQVMDPVIDVHHHMFAPHLVAALAAAGVDRLGGESVPASWNPEASLQVMDRYGIDVAILSTPVPLQFAEPAQRAAIARAVNDFGADCAHRWPQRFGSLATLPLPDVRASVVELRRALDELGADGVAFLTNHAGLYQGDSRLDPVYTELDRRGAVSFIHPTVPSGEAMPIGNAGSPLAALQPSLLEFPFDTTWVVANLVVSGTLERFPRIRHIVTHCGGCVPSVANRLIDRRPLVTTYTAMLQRGEVPSVERIETLMAEAQDEASRRLGTLHYDVALSSDPHVLAALTGVVRPSQLLLGTDFPMGQEIGVTSRSAVWSASRASTPRNATPSAQPIRCASSPDSPEPPKRRCPRSS
jgi:6-methylsalicylate decarboxylase